MSSRYTTGFEAGRMCWHSYGLDKSAHPALEQLTREMLALAKQHAVPPEALVPVAREVGLRLEMETNARMCRMWVAGHQAGTDSILGDKP